MTSSPPVETVQAPRRTISPTGIAVRAAISLAFLGGSVGLMIAIGRGSPPKRRPTDQSLPLVEVQRVQSYTGGIDFDVDGVVIPFREIEVHPVRHNQEKEAEEGSGGTAAHHSDTRTVREAKRTGVWRESG